MSDYSDKKKHLQLYIPKNQTDIQWQHLDIKSFICSSNERGISVPDKTVLDRVSDKCPIGYTQTFSRKFIVNKNSIIIDD